MTLALCWGSRALPPQAGPQAQPDLGGHRTQLPPPPPPACYLAEAAVGELFLHKASDNGGCRYELRCIIWKTTLVDPKENSLSNDRINDIYVKG